MVQYGISPFLECSRDQRSTPILNKIIPGELSDSIVQELKCQK
jgi:hypothetical protein